MMRKKNITLNGKKCDGSERVEEGDEISLFLADETIEKFSAPLPELAALGKEKDRNSGKAGKNGENGNRKKKQELSIVYEDKNVLIVNKPSGMLSQKAKEGDVSLNEHILNYLIDSGHLPVSQLRTFGLRSATVWIAHQWSGSCRNFSRTSDHERGLKRQEHP
ncbi:MAG: hypothetical protein ACLUB3_12705 [Clostridium sp.]